MSNCCVKGCKTRKRAGDTISFHRFPKSEPCYSLWLQSCGRGDWRPPSVHSRICSIHFEEHLLIKSESVTYLVPGAVPTKFIHQSEVKQEETDEIKFPKKIANPITRTSTKCNELILVCRVCLKTDRRMFILDSDLLFVYQNVTDIQINLEDELPKMLCWECKHRVISCNQFITLARNSNHLLVELQNCETNLTSEKIKSLYTEEISHLVQKSYPPDYCDYNVIDDNVFEEIENKTQTEYIDVVIDIKNGPISVDALSNETGTHHDINEADKSDVTDSETTKTIFAETLTKEKVKVKVKKVRKKKHQVPEELDPDVFVTTKLTPENQKREIEQRKETDNYKLSPYKCEECYKGFLNEETYKSHMARHSDQYGNVICEVCKVHFHSIRTLRRHMTSHTHRFDCKQCPFVTNLRNVAQSHYKYHKGTRYKCPKCEEDFGKVSTYLSHLRIKHPSDIVCQLCGFSFVSKKGLQMHKHMKHRFEENTISDSGPLCAECDIRFASEEALQQHYRVSERHKDSQVSPKMGRPLKYDTENEEMSSENVEKRKTIKQRRILKGPIMCEQCDKQLPNLLSYYWHFRNSHPDKNRTKYPVVSYKHMCEVCGKMFQCLSALQDHMPSHASTKQFQCPQCPKTFARRSRLAMHERVHGERPRYACPHCGKLFSRRSNMQRHTTSHSGVRPYKCEMCGKAFKLSSLMRIHISCVHLKKPWPKRTRTKTSKKQNTDSQVTAVSSTNTEMMEVNWEG